MGFLRAPDGTITVFDVPGAGTGPGQGTIGFCDNDFDAITGYYIGGAIYLNAQAGTPQRSGLVSKYDLSFQQFIGEFFGSYRLIEEPRGWLDLLGGRFTYLGDKVGLQANNMAIDAASIQLVDHFAQQLATPGSDLRTLVARNITDKLGYLMGIIRNCLWARLPPTRRLR